MLDGCGGQIWLNLLFCILGWVPGIIHAFWLIHRGPKRARRQEPNIVYAGGVVRPPPPLAARTLVAELDLTFDFCYLTSLDTLPNLNISSTVSRATSGEPSSPPSRGSFLCVRPIPPPAPLESHFDEE